ncbi:hypothetical protein BFJ63_vAg18547 [Fusarium oxysporum f. sp. narcissi]|uniref:Uncharacterized protein n=1 Tax=Fusarium oxysporum f. sp. narcissi TaxID=451672 RepID=A0A4Q2V1T3_FUSOX|nr:hypothetical protein BFJ63_vAg18547 [Fusarium oxysporum f. sp. narcissi]
MENTNQPSPSPETSPKALSHLVKPHRKITPPERKPRDLPSPPASDKRKRAPTVDELPQELVKFKRKCTTGGVAPLTSFHLSKADYERLHDKIEANFRRFDYDPRHQRIYFRMPSRIHDIFAQSIQDAIFNALSDLGRCNEQVCPFTTKIIKAATSDITIWDSDDETKDPIPLKRSPDAQFLYVGAEQPSVVVEVAYSQDKKHLPQLAKEYIHHTWGEIKAVLCFALNKANGSAISVWKPMYYPEEDSDEVEMKKEHVVQSQPFRTVDGSPINQDHELVLDLHDFVPDEECEGCANPSISIPYSKLYDSLVKAEQQVKTPRPSRAKRGVKRSRMSSESIESMTEEDKKQWKAKDRAARDKQIAEDGEYQGFDDGEKPAKKRTQEGRDCTKPSVVESDSDETVSG